MTVAASLVMTVSCNSFLKEVPKTFEQPDNYYSTEAQVRMGVNGAYYGYRMPLNNNGLNDGDQSLVLFEFLAGYARKDGSYFAQQNEVINLNIKDDNSFAAGPWGTLYSSLNNVNTMINILEKKEDIDITPESRKRYLGEVLFLRALYYFNLVRYYGPVPMKTTPTTGFSDAQLPLSSEAVVYGQIVNDLTQAETLMEEGGTAWNNADGRISKGAVKALLAKVYLTMAGYPIKDNSAYKKAYDKALEVVKSGQYSLYDTYEQARLGYDTNGKEYILSIQCMKDQFHNPLHMISVPRPGGTALQPYISMYDATRPGGGWAPCPELYNSYAEGDKRTENHAFYFTTQAAMDEPSVVHTFSPSVYKYWDEDAVHDGKCGKNFPILRYADILLTLAEAACAGGSTSDAEAINAYYQVRHRAMPSESKPSSITFEQVFKERIWEQAFDGENWFNMIRTRKAFDFAQKKVVDLIGHKAPGLTDRYEEADLLLPYPVDQVRLNPNLKR